jgi:hemerythrin-like domain-containing protein
MKGEGLAIGKATQDLKQEHDAILHVLKIINAAISAGDQAESEKSEYFKQMVYFLKIFADKCHHGKEENYLFETLVKAGVPNEEGPIGVMLRDHDWGRECISLMDQALETKNLAKFIEAASIYRDLLIGHIDKENNILFTMADDLLNEQQQEEMFEKFEQYEESVIGHGVHEELHGMIHKWSEEFGVN